ncbi:MAG TPA: helix-turn-helix domain-containing protein [Anaerolineae bacterium]|nr:helix-turn-helix domain-containing protein [Anaerolineae bacterium]
MDGDLIDKLVQIGFSEYEAKAYVALLRESPVTGYQLSKMSGVPRSMIYEVLAKLVARGAAMTLRKEGGTQYAPVPAAEFLDKLHREQEQLFASLQSDLDSLGSASDLDYVWNIEGYENILAKAEEMIGQARESIYLALKPDTFVALQPMLEEAVQRGVRAVIYTASALDLPGGQVVVTPMSEEAASRVEGLGLILVVDGEGVLISEWLTASQARASWASSPLLVFIAEHHLRTDPYLPQILACLGERAADIIREEDRELFARAMESHIGD